MLQEPFLVVLAFYLLFLFVIVYVRLDFSITKVSKILNSYLTISLLWMEQVHYTEKHTIYYVENSSPKLLLHEFLFQEISL